MNPPARGSGKRFRSNAYPRSTSRNFSLRSLIIGLLFVSPWIAGFLLFLLYPLLSNLHLGFTEYSGFGEPNWVGWQNYQELLRDPLFWQSLANTLIYVSLAVPLGLLVAILLGIAMNQKVRETALYRSLLYLPSIVPIFALALIFVWLMNPKYGLLNYGLRFLHIPAIDWLGDPHWSKISIVLLAQFGAGPYGLIFLAAMRSIPPTIYSAAELDGASDWRKFWYITLPLITPTILYDLIIGVGQGLQVFVPAYIMTEGGPLNSTMFTALYIYKNAFEYSRFGFAAAIAGLLFLFNTGIALSLFWSSRFWVNYRVD